MQVKKFTGKSLPEAIRKAKEQYGDDIILLESKEVPNRNNGSKEKVVEVTLSVNENDRKVKSWKPPVLEQETSAPAREMKKQAKGDEFNQVINNILSKRNGQFSQEKKILEELAELRQQINALQTQGARGKDELPAPYAQIQKELTDKGFDEALAETFMGRAYRMLEKKAPPSRKEIITAVQSEMKRRLQPYEFHPDSEGKKQRVVLILGGSGSGKTTSAMKLAAHPEIYGKNDTAFISTDIYGPSEALKAFSKMTGTPVVEAQRKDEFHAALEKFSDKEVVLVDTPGKSPFAPNYLDDLEAYINQIKPTDIFLTLGMNSDIKDLFLSSSIYLLLKPTGLILTKFDETSQPGKLFSIIEEIELPVACMCEGKRIFIDIVPGNADYVFNKIFETE